MGWAAVVLLLPVGGIVQAGNVYPPNPPAPIHVASKQRACPMSDPSLKFSPETKRYLNQSAIAGNVPVRVILRTRQPLEQEQRTQLQTVGAEIGTVAGDIVTVTISFQFLLSLAELDFVTAIELSRPLSPE